MPYNGAGTFTSLGVPTFPAVTGDYILASYFNATMNDIFLGLSTALPRDGQAAMTANLPMGAFKITGLGNGSNPQDATTFSQVFTAPTFSNATFTGITTIGAGALISGYALLASPALTGIPTAPTAVYGTDTEQLATMAALKDAIDLLPSGALPSVTGKDTTWKLQVNSGGTGVEWGQLVINGSGGRVITGNVTLTVTSGSIPNAAISVTPATPGLYVTLPDATTVTTESVTQISIYNAGDYDYGVKDSAGTQLGWVRPRTGAIVGLADNSTAAGVWAPYGLEKTGITASFSNSSVTGMGIPQIRQIALDSNRTCFLFGSTSCYAVVYDDSAKTWGTPVLVRSSLGTSGGQYAAYNGVLAATDKILVCSCTATTGFEAVVLSISSSTVTVNTAATATLSGNIYIGVGVFELIAVGSSFVIGYGVDTPNNEIRAITVSGTTPSIGAASTLGSSAQYFVALYASGSVVRTVCGNTTTTIYCKPFTVSGTTLTAGTQTTTAATSAYIYRSFLNGNGNIVIHYSNTTEYAAVVKLTGTTDAISAVNLGTPTSAVLSNGDYVQVTASKTAFIGNSAGAAWYINILTDTGGTASAGTEVSGGGVGTPNYLCGLGASGNTAYFITSGGQSVAQISVDCSGASPSVTGIQAQGMPTSFVHYWQPSTRTGVSYWTMLAAGNTRYSVDALSAYSMESMLSSGPRQTKKMPLAVTGSGIGVKGALNSVSYLMNYMASSAGTGAIIQKIEAAA